MFVRKKYGPGPKLFQRLSYDHFTVLTVIYCENSTICHDLVSYPLAAARLKRRRNTTGRKNDVTRVCVCVVTTRLEFAIQLSDRDSSAWPYSFGLRTRAAGYSFSTRIFCGGAIQSCARVCGGVCCAWRNYRALSSEWSFFQIV